MECVGSEPFFFAASIFPAKGVATDMPEADFCVEHHFESAAPGSLAKGVVFAQIPVAVALRNGQRHEVWEHGRSEAGVTLR